MTDGSTRLIGIASVLLGVWVVTYWFYQPRNVTLDPRTEPVAPSMPHAPGPAPVDPPPSNPPPPNDVKPPGAEAAPALSPSRMVQRLLPPRFREYTVQAGDTSFEAVAARPDIFGNARMGSVVARSNPFVSPDRLKAGQTVLKIPLDPDNIQGKTVWVDQSTGEVVPDAAAPAPTAEARTYTLRGEDTLSGVAEKFYGKASLWRRIAEANLDVIPNPNRLRPGTVIRIPPAP